jgi:hypothetical protein
VLLARADGLRGEIPAGPTDAVTPTAAVRSRVRAGIPDTDKVSFLAPFFITPGPSHAVGSRGSNDRDGVMEQGLRKERAISGAALTDGGKTFCRGKWRGGAIQGFRRAGLRDENVTKAIKSRSECV